MRYLPLLLLVAACSPSSVAPSRAEPIAATLALTAFRDGSTVRVTAQLRSDRGENIVGQAIAFNASSGSPSPQSAITNDAGMAGTIVATDAAVTVSATTGALTQLVSVDATPPLLNPGSPFPTPQPPQPAPVLPWRITADRVGGTAQEGTAYFLHARAIEGATSYLWSFSGGDTTRTATPVVQYVFEDGEHHIRLEAHDREYRTLAIAETGITARR